jgi:hypothetical protein
MPPVLSIILALITIAICIVIPLVLETHAENKENNNVKKL